jgi:hypothetical protein
VCKLNICNQKPYSLCKCIHTLSHTFCLNPGRHICILPASSNALCTPEVRIMRGWKYALEFHLMREATCRKLHQDPQIISDFPQFFPKPICAVFKSRDPGAYPCRVAALVSAKTPEFLLSILIHHFPVMPDYCPPHSFSMERFYGLMLDVIQCIFLCHVV